MTAWWQEPEVVDTITDRLLSKVQVSPEVGGCWLWLGATSRSGYGTMALDVPGGSVARVYVHRLSYELTHRPLRRKEQVDHTCNTRNCVNPLHLEAVSQAENLRRRDDRRRAAASQAVA